MIIIVVVVIMSIFIMMMIIVVMDQELIGKLEMADTRSENAEMDIGRLNVRIDKVAMMLR